MLLRTGIVILALARISAGSLHAEPVATATMVSVVSVVGTSFAENLASREVRRYVYLRTGKLLPIIVPAIEGPSLIVAGCLARRKRRHCLTNSCPRTCP